jgi:hypothetical protein
MAVTRRDLREAAGLRPADPDAVSWRALLSKPTLPLMILGVVAGLGALEEPTWLMVSGGCFALAVISHVTVQHTLLRRRLDRLEAQLDRQETGRA